VAGKKHRFDDTEYLEQSKDIVDGVKNAVAAGLLKKRKKAKTQATPAAISAPVVAPANPTLIEEVVKKVVESEDTPIVATVAAVAIGAVAAASG